MESLFHMFCPFRPTGLGNTLVAPDLLAMFEPGA